MRAVFSRTIRITTLLLLLVAALLFGALCAAGGTAASAATNYDLGHLQITINLTYGAELNEPPRQINGEEKYFRVKTFNASESIGGETFSLTEGGRVTATPGTYYLSAPGNAVPCYKTGTEMPDATCTGYLEVVVAKNEMTVSLPAAALTKVYGDLGEKPTWTDAEAGEEPDLVITFDTPGRAAVAAVKEDYALTVDSVMLFGVERKEYYKITAKVEETGAAAVYSVTPLEVVFDYDVVDEVRFNDYLLADGVGVTTRECAGMNGDVLTGYFRLKDPVEGSLAVGENYEVELYRYDVTPAEGEAASYSSTETSNYSVSATYTATVVKAKAGNVIVYQDASLIEARQGDARYLYLSPSTFTYTYFDLIKTDVGDVMTGGGEPLYPSVTFYLGVTGTVRVSVENVKEGDVPVGEYEMTLLDYVCPEIESLSFDHVFLHVEPLVIDEPYNGTDEAEITLSNTFERTVTRTYKEKEYSFTLTADLTDKGVGASVAYSSMICTTDPGNVTIAYDEAQVTVVKRHTGVSLAHDETKSVSYGMPIGVLAEPRLAGEAIGSDHASVIYRYRAGNGSVSFNGLPTAVGAYVVTCSLESDLYEADPVEVSVTITKRQVAALYRVSVARKVYGESFSYKTGASVQIVELYPFEAGNADREQTVDFASSDFSGVILSSLGFDAAADVGTYEFVTSGAASFSFEIVQGFVYDASAEREVTRFTVDKAPAPPAPEATVSVTKDRSIKVTAAGSIVARIAKDAAMTPFNEQSGNGSVTFTKVANKKPLYGEVFYVSVRAEAGANYENASGWSDAVSVSVPFTAPSVAVSVLKSDGAEFTYTELTDSVDGYVLKYRVGSSGEWKASASAAERTLSVGSLRADTAYTVWFRAEKEGVVGAASSVEIRTLRAPIAAEKVSVTYDRVTGVLDVSVEDGSAVGTLEYCLCKETGEELTVWSETPRFDAVAKDGKYILKVRYAEDEEGELLSSEPTEITIDTHKPKVPVTWRSVLSDWFLAIVGGVLLVLTIVFLVTFVKKKKKIDREEA